MSRFQILSIDGGGMKGIFSAAFFAAIENLTGKRIVDHYNLIVGTSTGGITALCLGIGMPACDILGLYRNEGELIFPGGAFQRFIGVAKLVYKPKYDPMPLETTLKKHLKDSRLGESITRLVIPCFNPATGDVYLYKTAHHPRLRDDYKKPMWEIARATSAAPSYFRSHKIGFHTDLVDGGLWANNPSMVALTEAIGMLQQAPENIAMLSIGTALSRVSIGQRTREAGGLVRWGWAVSTKLFMHLQAIVAHNQASQILERGYYLRIDPSTFPGTIPMDHPKKAIDLISFGEQAARNNRSSLEQMFFDEPAEPFIPEYSGY